MNPVHVVLGLVGLGAGIAWLSRGSDEVVESEQLRVVFAARMRHESSPGMSGLVLFDGPGPARGAGAWMSAQLMEHLFDVVIPQAVLEIAHGDPARAAQMEGLAGHLYDQGFRKGRHGLLVLATESHQTQGSASFATTGSHVTMLLELQGVMRDARGLSTWSMAAIRDAPVMDQEAVHDKLQQLDGFFEDQLRRASPGFSFGALGGSPAPAVAGLLLSRTIKMQAS